VVKALEPVGGVPLARPLVELREHFAGVAVVGPRGVGLDALGVPVVEDLVVGRGAPGGLATALEHAGTPWICALACDMPTVTVEALQALYALREGAEAVVARVGDRLHPLHAFYSKAAARRCGELATEGRSLHALLKALRTVELDLEAHAGSVTNVNTPEELAAIRMMKGPGAEA